jgi:predicted oxidoreductase
MADLRIPEPKEHALDVSSPRALGSHSLVFPLALGCWRLTGSDDNNERLVNSAVEHGITLIDNADVYGLDWGGTHFGACEEALGRVFQMNRGLRERVVLATKAGIVPGTPYNSSREYIVSACEASLQRMGVDYVDLFQIHRPDVFTHPEELAESLQLLQQRGLIRDIGVSNYTTSQTLALNAFLDEGLVATQPEFSALHLDPMRDGTLDLCMEAGITPLAWSPLAGGRLATGKDVPPQLLATLDTIASRENVSRAAVALAFVLVHPSAPIAIIGTQQPERITDLVKATSVNLTRTDVYAIIQASDGVPLP